MFTSISCYPDAQHDSDMRKNSSATGLSKMHDRRESRGSVGRVGTSDSLDQKEKDMKSEKVRRAISVIKGVS